MRIGVSHWSSDKTLLRRSLGLALFGVAVWLCATWHYGFVIPVDSAVAEGKSNECEGIVAELRWTVYAVTCVLALVGALVALRPRINSGSHSTKAGCEQ